MGRHTRNQKQKLNAEATEIGWEKSGGKDILCVLCISLCVPCVMLLTFVL